MEILPAEKSMIERAAHRVFALVGEGNPNKFKEQMRVEWSSLSVGRAYPWPLITTHWNRIKNGYELAITPDLKTSSVHLLIKGAELCLA